MPMLRSGTPGIIPSASQRSVIFFANVVDCLIRSMIALFVQIIVYYIVKIPVPKLSERIAAGELAAARFCWSRSRAMIETVAATKTSEGRNAP